MALFSTVLCLVSLCLGQTPDYIEIQNSESTQEYYVRFQLKNVDASACGDAIDVVQIWYKNSWYSPVQFHPSYEYAWDWDFTNPFELPISVKITMNSLREITLTDIITNWNDWATFTSTELVCTPYPTAVTNQPTLAPTYIPTKSPTHRPTSVTNKPSISPTHEPTTAPTGTNTELQIDPFVHQLIQNTKHP